jgi:hypothetical protein
VAIFCRSRRVYRVHAFYCIVNADRLKPIISIHCFCVTGYTLMK